MICSVARIIKDSIESCESMTTPWYLRDAVEGDADAQLNLAGCLEQGSGVGKTLVTTNPFSSYLLHCHAEGARLAVCVCGVGLV